MWPTHQPLFLSPCKTPTALQQQSQNDLTFPSLWEGVNPITAPDTALIQQQFLPFDAPNWNPDLELSAEQIAEFFEETSSAQTNALDSFQNDDDQPSAADVQSGRQSLFVVNEDPRHYPISGHNYAANFERNPLEPVTATTPEQLADIAYHCYFFGFSVQSHAEKIDHISMVKIFSVSPASPFYNILQPNDLIVVNGFQHSNAANFIQRIETLFLAGIKFFEFICYRKDRQEQAWIKRELTFVQNQGNFQLNAIKEINPTLERTKTQALITAQNSYASLPIPNFNALARGYTIDWPIFGLTLAALSDSNSASVKRYLKLITILQQSPEGFRHGLDQISVIKSISRGSLIELQESDVIIELRISLKNKNSIPQADILKQPCNTRSLSKTLSYLEKERLRITQVLVTGYRGTEETGWEKFTATLTPTSSSHISQKNRYNPYSKK